MSLRALSGLKCFTRIFISVFFFFFLKQVVSFFFLIPKELFLTFHLMQNRNLLAMDFFFTLACVKKKSSFPINFWNKFYWVKNSKLKVYSFSTLSMLLNFLLSWIISNKKICGNSYLSCSVCNNSFFLGVFKFPIYYQVPGSVFSMHALLWICWISWRYRFNISIKSLKFLVIISL